MERLKRRTDFRAAATGARAPASAFVLQALPRAETGTPRVGFTVSKQVGNAVERNRVRRRLREIVRLTGAAALRDGHDYVLVGRRAALGTPFGELTREFGAALDRVHAGKHAGRARTDAARTDATRTGAAATGAASARPLRQAGPASRPRRAKQPRKEHCKEH